LCEYAYPLSLARGWGVVFHSGKGSNGGDVQIMTFIIWSPVFSRPCSASGGRCMNMPFSTGMGFPKPKNPFPLPSSMM